MGTQLSCSLVLTVPGLLVTGGQVQSRTVWLILGSPSWTFSGLCNLTSSSRNLALVPGGERRKFVQEVWEDECFLLVASELPVLPAPVLLPCTQVLTRTGRSAKSTPTRERSTVQNTNHRDFVYLTGGGAEGGGRKLNPLAQLVHLNMHQALFLACLLSLDPHRSHALSENLALSPPHVSTLQSLSLFCLTFSVALELLFLMSPLIGKSCASEPAFAEPHLCVGP